MLQLLRAFLLVLSIFKYTQSQNQQQLSSSNNFTLPYFEDQITNPSSRQLSSGQIRLNFDTTQLGILSDSSDLKQDIVNVLNVAQKFFQDLLALKTITQNDIYLSASIGTSCGGYSYTQAQLTQGFLATDLEILVGVQLDTSIEQNFRISSYICQRDSNNNRPNVGAIIVIIKKLDLVLSDYLFEQLLKQVIHCVAHVIAFDSSSLPYFKDSSSNSYSASQIDITSYTLALPNILLWAQQHFSCLTLQAIPIEIMQSTNIHWNRAFLLDDVMSGLYSQGQQLWSGINNAFLKDSGWYTVTESMYDQSIKWGKAKGCSFIQNGCSDTTNSFDEFCGSLGSIGINLSRESMSSCQLLYPSTSAVKTSVPAALRSCMFMMKIANRNCQNTGNTQTETALVNDFMYYFGADSRSFVSSLTPLNYSAYTSVGCYQTSCSSDLSQINISLNNTYNFSCHHNADLLKPIQTFILSGTLSCPNNISSFCSAPIPCPSFCSSKGYCINGECTCLSSYTGEGCQCNLGTYYNAVQKTCVQCEDKCQTCNSSSPSSCYSCQDGYYLSGTTCLECKPNCLTCSNSLTCTSCIEGYYLNPSTQLCEHCPVNCDQCTSSTSCSRCEEGYGFDAKNSACSITCHYSCLRCYSTPLQCTECFFPKYLNTTNHSCQCPTTKYEDAKYECSDCPDNCLGCISSSVCEECNSDSKLLPIQRICFSNKDNLKFVQLYFLLLMSLIMGY